MSLHLPLRQACGGVIGVIPELQGRIRDRWQNKLLKPPEKGEGCRASLVERYWIACGVRDDRGSD